MKRLALAALCLAFAACSSSEETNAPVVSQDSGADSSSPEAPSEAEGPDGESEAQATDGAGEEASTEASASEGGNPFGACEGSCAQTSATIKMGSTAAPVERAQFGFNAPVQGASTLHIEAHLGGDPACPTTSSSTPDLTVIFGSVPIPVDSTPIENTPVTLLDFTGDLSPNPFDKATNATLTPVAIQVDPSDNAFFAFDVNVTFPNGTMTGHVYATHCDSMDE